MSYSQHCGYWGRVKEGHGVLYRDYIMGPTRVPLCKIHVLCGLALSIDRRSGG